VLKTRSLIAAELLLIAALLAACGPSAAQQTAVVTQIAAQIFATLTAGAPTLTPTFTPSATPTETLTPTPTPTITRTPQPSDTPTPTPTPAPVLSVVALTVDDLPAGFEPTREDTLRTLERTFPEDSYVFGFEDPDNAQALIGVLIPYPSRLGQAGFDAALPEFMTGFMKGVGIETGIRDLGGMEDVGDTRLAKTAVSPGGALPARWDIIAFRRGEVGVLLFVGYPDADEPARPLADLAHLLDQRIMQFLSGDPIGLSRAEQQ
jgi:hypothetical protein